jgi:formylglycine-generating enzyme required for sulfatase activity
MPFPLLAFGIPSLVNSFTSFLHRGHSEQIAKGNQTNQLAISEKQRETQLRIEELRMRQQELALHEQRELQQLLASYNRETQFAIAAFQRETALKQPEINKILENWGLRLFPSQILGSHAVGDVIPLRIIISPPTLNFDKFGGDANVAFPRIESYLAQTMKDFLDSNYPQNSQERPTELLDGVVESKKNHGNAMIKALFGMLNSEPTLILESEIDGDYLNFKFAYWGMAASTPVYETVFSRFPYRDMVYESAKENARRWKPTHDRLKQRGEKPEEFNKTYTHNLKILEHEEDFLAHGDDVKSIQHLYNLQKEDFNDFFEFLGLLHCLLTGWAADYYHLTHYETMPALPGILPELLKGIPDGNAALDVLRTIAESYVELYEDLICSQERQSWAPDLLMQLAMSFSRLSDSSIAIDVAKKSLQSWLKLREVDVQECDLEKLIEEIQKHKLGASDRDYIQQLNQFLAAINRSELQVALPEVPAIESFVSQRFTFEVVTVNRQGGIAERRVCESKYFIENLGNAALEMVSVPGSQFLMGAPESEEGSDDDERPQHQVTVPPFFMGKYPVTQAQWKAIAQLERIDRDLDPDPSRFKGDDRPVERVSWHEAIEFCKRLSRLTGRDTYRLPTEAEWEYACRGGSQTPFAYGETITTDLVNFDGDYIYGLAPKGKYREQTTNVGSFPPNAFGLCDIHGNVWEWCQDTWHDNYNNAPNDGSAWIDNNNHYQLLRGGSWNSYPRSCRCASRDGGEAGGRNSVNGFRVVCAVPRLL